jgi:hypothetical protein
MGHFAIIKRKLLLFGKKGISWERAWQEEPSTKAGKARRIGLPPRREVEAKCSSSNAELVPRKQMTRGDAPVKFYVVLDRGIRNHLCNCA